VRVAFLPQRVDGRAQEQSERSGGDAERDSRAGVSCGGNVQMAPRAPSRAGYVAQSCGRQHERQEMPPPLTLFIAFHPTASPAGCSSASTARPLVWKPQLVVQHLLDPHHPIPVAFASRPPASLPKRANRHEQPRKELSVLLGGADHHQAYASTNLRKTLDTTGDCCLAWAMDNL
jgi:hypothetical protein